MWSSGKVALKPGSVESVHPGKVSLRDIAEAGEASLTLHDISEVLIDGSACSRMAISECQL